MTWDDNGAPSNYNGLVLKLQKRFSAGLSFLTSYTWSHNLDIWSTERNGTSGGHRIRSTGARTTPLRLPTCGMHFLLSGVYELPFGHGKRI